MKRNLLIGILPLIFGGLIYLTFRSETLSLFTWLNNAGQSDIVEMLRSSRFLQAVKLPDWVKFSLPDALWLFSFNYLLLSLWKFDFNRGSSIWLFISSAIGISSEIGQLTGLVPGTFDPIDLGFLLFAAFIPFIFAKNLILKFDK